MNFGIEVDVDTSLLSPYILRNLNFGFPLQEVRLESVNFEIRGNVNTNMLSFYVPIDFNFGSLFCKE